MLDLQRYTRQELIDIFKTQRLDSIKDKLKRKGYKFTTDGRGDSFTLTITELPLRFRNFCTDELNFAPQTDFVKLKRFLYRFIFDEDFRHMPNKGMARLMKDDIKISNQTISKYILKLYNENIIGFSKEGFYYSIDLNYKEQDNYCKRITAEEYRNAWQTYWQTKEENNGDYVLAYNCMCSLIDGHPHRKAIVMFNAIEKEKIETLKEILKEEIDINE